MSSAPSSVATRAASRSTSEAAFSGSGLGCAGGGDVLRRPESPLVRGGKGGGPLLARFVAPGGRIVERACNRDRMVLLGYAGSWGAGAVLRHETSGLE